MSSSLFARLFSCCIRSRTPDDESTVIPNETSRLIPASAGPSSPGLPDAIVVDHQKLNDKLGTIVRSKEGKMVNVSSRAPFTLHSASTPVSPTSLTFPAPGSSATPTSPAPRVVTVLPSRRPPILTMTPARSQASLNLYADSRYSSPSASRSSSRRRPEPATPAACPTSAAPSDLSRGKGSANEWFAESESELSADAGSSELEPPPPPAPGVAIMSPAALPAAEPGNANAIAFSWGDA
ncbi:hypothetical protein B0H10DRAFT_1984688 [Mycena sp. CBHHK59/15]|nr:hypothetical protein B0H10DRAFT_1984688 [Mycena sp. CBHHK59/15]